MRLISARHEEHRWMQEIRQGDVRAFENLYRRYYTDLTGFLLRYVRDGAIAEELYQDIFLQVWRRRQAWRPRGTVKSFLYRAARNRAIDHLRRQQRKLSWIEHEQARLRHLDANQPDLELCYREFAEALEVAVAEMPERRRLVFVLSREHHLTYHEIADVLGISVKTVETQMGRALRVLRQVLATYTSRVA